MPHVLRRSLVLALCLCLPAACSYPRFHGTQAPSRTFDHPQASELGKHLAERGAEHPGLSGVHLLASGLDAFAARVELIDEAQFGLDLQYYILRDDVTGRFLLSRLLAAADRGVRVRLLLDDLGSGGLDALIAAANAHPRLEVRLFNARARGPWNGLAQTLDLLWRPLRLDRRMHNKMLMADGAVAVVGGRNLGDEYFDATPNVAFSDLDLLAYGPVLSHLGESFDRYWNSEFAAQLDGWGHFERSFCDLAELRAELLRHEHDSRQTTYAQRLLADPLSAEIFAGEVSLIWARTHAAADLPEKIVSRGAALVDTLLITQLRHLIPQAREDLLIVSPYFVPQDAGVEHLVGLAQSGVRVRVLTNSLRATDVPMVHAGYMSSRRALLEGGVELFEVQRAGDRAAARYRKGLIGSKFASLHSKTFVVDGRHVFVGSMNLDPRSAHLNTELGLVVESEALARDLTALLEEGLTPDASWKLSLIDGELHWAGRVHGEDVDSASEPGLGWWTAFKLWCFRLLPLESQL